MRADKGPKVEQWLRFRHWAGIAVLVVLATVIAACGPFDDDDDDPVPTPDVTLTPDPPPDETPAPTPEETPDPTPTPIPDPEVGREVIDGPGDRIPWAGEETFLFGINYPYYHYGNDFGDNNWGDRGVSYPETYTAIDQDFEALSEMGVPSVRWFVFADGRAGIEFDEDGMPLGLDLQVYDDMGAALTIAERHGIYIHFVLLDFMWMYDATFQEDVQVGGHSHLVNTSEGRQALVSNVFEPLLRSFGGHPNIMTWEVINEPEWAISGDAGDPDNEVSDPATLDDFRALVGDTVELIHEHTNAYATVGSASMRWIDNWFDLGLDYYQVHYWEWMAGDERDDIFAVDYWSLDLDRPLVIGEFSAGGSDRASLDGYLQHWYEMGYAGAWPWSFRSVDQHGPPDAGSLAEWASANSDEIEIPLLDPPDATSSAPRLFGTGTRK